MLPDELERVADRHVPGAGKLDIERLSHGVVNDTYQVRRGGAAYAMRVAAHNPWRARNGWTPCCVSIAPGRRHRQIRTV